LNMAVPPTPRDSKTFSTLGLLQAAVTGLTDPAYANTNLQNIPNMDGFPNGRRLEDDVTRIELQAVGGVVLAALGLWYDDYTVGGSPLTPQLISAISYTTGIEKNDAPFKPSFPYLATPWAGTHICDCGDIDTKATPVSMGTGAKVFQELKITAPEVVATTAPNPFVGANTITYKVDEAAQISVAVYDVEGHLLKVLVNKTLKPGTYNHNWNGDDLKKGIYFIKITKDGVAKQSLRVVKG